MDRRIFLKTALSNFRATAGLDTKALSRREAGTIRPASCAAGAIETQSISRGFQSRNL